MPAVHVLRSGSEIKGIELETRDYLIGRDESCEIVLEGAMVSRKHARLEVSEHALYVEDLGSMNGTRVRGMRVARHKISPGDVVSIGEYELTFEEMPGTGEGTRGSSETRHIGETAIIEAIDASSVAAGTDVREGVANVEAVASRLVAMCELGQRLCGRLEISEIAEKFLEVLLRVFARADRAVLLVRARMGQALEPLAAKGRDTSGGCLRVSQTVISAVLDEKQAVLCGDTSSDARFKDSASLQDLQIRSIMCVPLLVSDKVLGLVEVDSGKAGISFRDSDLRLLAGLASQTSIAIENARLYSEIEQSKRLAAIGQTVSGVAHCVKNVLNGIDGGLFIARRGLEAKSEDKIGKGWDMLERNASFLKGLVLDMLDYSKDRPPEYEAVNLAELLKELVAFVEGRAAEGQISVSLSVDPDIGLVSVDPKRIKRALLNILSNALEATPQGGKVEIRAGMSSISDFFVSIADTGRGIPDEIKANIFEPFYSTKGSKGTGLGLSVTKKIVEEHGGQIDLMSTCGKGTVFTFILPVRTRDIASDNTKAESSD